MGGICILDCFVGEYRVGEGEKFNCEKCYESCMECKGLGVKNCILCFVNLVLYMDDSCCFYCCNIFDFISVQECCDCQDIMEECIF